MRNLRVLVATVLMALVARADYYNCSADAASACGADEGVEWAFEVDGESGRARIYGVGLKGPIPDAVTVPATVKDRDDLSGASYPVDEFVVPGELGALAAVRTWRLSEGIVTISGGFTNSVQLETLVLPSTLTTIGDALCEDVETLRQVNWSDLAALTKIGSRAFRGSGIESVFVPRNASLGLSVFKSCTNLTAVVFEDARTRALTKIPVETFYGCTSLAGTVELPNRTAAIEARAFMDCKRLTGVILPKSLTSILRSAFENTGLKEVSLPDSLRVIEDSAFNKVSAVFRLSGMNLTKIGESAFPKAKYVVFTGKIPPSLGLFDTKNTGRHYAYPAEYTEYEENGLTRGWKNVSVAGVKPLPTMTTDGVSWLFKYDGETAEVCGYLNALPQKVVVPGKVNGFPVTALGASLFAGETAIADVTLPATVTAIGERAFAESSVRSVNLPAGSDWIGDAAFAYCAQLETVKVETPRKALLAFDDNYLFTGCPKLKPFDCALAGTFDLSGEGLTLVRAREMFADDTIFTDCGGGYRSDGALYADTGRTILIKVLEAPDGVFTAPKSVRIYTVGWENGIVKTLDLSAGTESILPHAFEGATLESIKIPKTVTTIGSYAFLDAQLKSVVYRGDEPTADRSIYEGLAGGFVIYTNVAIQIEAQVGRYVKWTLPELDIIPPKAGTVYSVKAYGLPSGLKLKYNAAVKNKKGKVTVKAKTNWWIEGVPTATLDALKGPMYLAVTVGKTTTWHSVQLTVTEQAVTDMGAFTVGTAMDEVCWLPGVTNGWTVSGLPKGLSYTAKTIYVNPKAKKKVVKYAPYTTYGKFSAAGLYTVTAKKKVGSFYETLKFRVLVEPAGEFTTRELTAYVALSPTITNKNLKAVSGLPAGVTFNAKKYIVSGKPTKAGTFAVTFTDKQGKKTVEMWQVAVNADGPALGFNTTGETTMTVVQGQKGAANELAFAADGTVSASGLPKGMKLIKKTDPETGVVSYALGGTPTTTGTYFVTVKAVKNGQTVAQRVAVTVKANPLSGTYYGYSISRDGEYRYRTATLSITASGKATVKYTEGSKTYTLTTSAGELKSNGKGATYQFIQKANAKKKIPARTVEALLFTGDTGPLGGEWAVAAGSDDYILVGVILKAQSAATVNALRTDLETGFAAKSTYLLTLETDPGQVIYATYAYSSSTGKFTVKGKLPLGKAFSATVSAINSEYGNLMLTPISAADADGSRYLLMLTPGGDGLVYMDGFDGAQADSQRYDFGTGYEPLPATFSAAIANSVTNFAPVRVTYPAKGEPATSEREWLCIRANGTKYFQVSFDQGATWSAKAAYKYDKTRGLITLSFTNSKTKAKYAVDLLYAEPGLLYGQVKRQSNPVYNKKTKKTTYTTEYGKAAVGET